MTNEPWSLPPPGAVANDALKVAFAKCKLPMPRSTVVTYSLQLHFALMATGRYLGVVPGSMLHFNARRLRLGNVQVNTRLRPGPVGIVTLKNRTLSPLAQQFIEAARDLAAPLRKMV